MAVLKQTSPTAVPVAPRPKPSSTVPSASTKSAVALGSSQESPDVPVTLAAGWVMATYLRIILCEARGSRTPPPSEKDANHAWTMGSAACSLRAGGGGLHRRGVCAATRQSLAQARHAVFAHRAELRDQSHRPRRGDAAKGCRGLLV